MKLVQVYLCLCKQVQPWCWLSSVRALRSSELSPRTLASCQLCLLVNLVQYHGQHQWSSLLFQSYPSGQFHHPQPTCWGKPESDKYEWYHKGSCHWMLPIWHLRITSCAYHGVAQAPKLHKGVPKWGVVDTHQFIQKLMPNTLRSVLTPLITLMWWWEAESFALEQSHFFPAKIDH